MVTNLEACRHQMEDFSDTCGITVHTYDRSLFLQRYFDIE